jgi:VWFA-related protein
MKIKYISIVTITLMFAALLGIAQQTETTPVAARMTGNPGSKYIEVIVLNDDDEHILGLQKNAFKLSLNGVEQQISSIKEINLLKASEDSRQYDAAKLKDNPLYHFILIANVPADNRQINKMKTGLLDFLSENENIGAPMQIFIVNPDNIYKLTELTNNTNTLSAELVNAFSAKMFCNEMSFFMEDTKFNLIKHLTEFASALEKLEGTKKIIFMSAGIPDTFGLDYFDTLTDPLMQAPEDRVSDSEKKGQSLEQQRQEAKKRKEFADSLSVLAGILNISNIKIDYVDLSSSTRSSRPGEGLADSRSSSLPSASSQYTGGSDFSNAGNQYAYGSMMKVTSEVKLRIAKDLAAAGGGELFEKAVSSSGKLQDYLNQILYNNAHYYLIEFKPKVTAESESKLNKINLEVENDDVEKVIYNQNLYLE